MPDRGWLSQAKAGWVNNYPNALLLLASSQGEITYNSITQFSKEYLNIDNEDEVRLINSTIDYLSFNGHLFETKSRTYGVIPPYAIQKSAIEWMIFGDNRIDFPLADNLLFETRSKFENGELIQFDRILVIDHDEALEAFRKYRVRTFEQRELLGALPDIHKLSTPSVWPNYRPNPYPNWEIVGFQGNWIGVNSAEQTINHICRGFLVNQKNKVVDEKYFYHFQQGWSPMTRNEARLWLFKLAYQNASPLHATYKRETNTLNIPGILPSNLYMTLKHIGANFSFNKGFLSIEGLKENIAVLVCNNLGVVLKLEG
jgi:hypothetical protein